MGPTNFLSLPRELREVVYQLVYRELDEEEEEYWQQPLFQPLNCTLSPNLSEEDAFRQAHSYFLYFRRHFHRRHPCRHWGLLLSCVQVYQEVLPFHVRQHRLVVLDPLELKTSLEAALPRARLDAVEHIGIVDLTGLAVLNPSDARRMSVWFGSTLQHAWNRHAPWFSCLKSFVVDLRFPYWNCTTPPEPYAIVLCQAMLNCINTTLTYQRSTRNAPGAADSKVSHTTSGANVVVKLSSDNLTLDKRLVRSYVRVALFFCNNGEEVFDHVWAQQTGDLDHDIGRKPACLGSSRVIAGWPVVPEGDPKRTLSNLPMTFNLRTGEVYEEYPWRFWQQDLSNFEFLVYLSDSAADKPLDDLRLGTDFNEHTMDDYPDPDEEREPKVLPGEYCSFRICSRQDRRDVWDRGHNGKPQPPEQEPRDKMPWYQLRLPPQVRFRTSADAFQVDAGDRYRKEMWCTPLLEFVQVDPDE